MASVEDLIKNHESSGFYIELEGVKAFVFEKGRGQAVLCFHGVPTSSFLYRKVISELASHGFRGICVDLPGLGLSDRPADFDYSFSGLARFLIKAIAQLKLEKFHLVVHDIGGPIGFAVASDLKSKVLSITVLNTWIDVVSFTKPLPMLPFEKPLLGEAELALITHPTWYIAFSTLAVENMDGISKEEAYVYVDLLKREDGGKGFLKIMRSFEKSDHFKRKCYSAVQNAAYPIQVLWGKNDPGLTFDRYGKEILEATGLENFVLLAGKHLLQEDQWKAIAREIEQLNKVSIATG